MDHLEIRSVLKGSEVCQWGGITPELNEEFHICTDTSSDPGFCDSRQQTSAFRYHGDKREQFNTLQYFTALKKAKSLASPESCEVRKRKNLDRSSESIGLCDIFHVQRPTSGGQEAYFLVIQFKLQGKGRYTVW